VVFGVRPERDGFLDLVGVQRGRATRWLGKGTAGYHWKVIRPRAQQNAGDTAHQRVRRRRRHSGAIGLLVQTQVLTGAPVHFGLGTHTAIDVARNRLAQRRGAG
jgi:hypothetical protein